VEYLGLLSSDRILTVNTALEEEIKTLMKWRQNPDVQVLLNNIPSIPMRVQENTSRTRVYYGIPLKAKILVTAGIINRGKSVDMLIQCLPNVRRDDLYLVIVGEGSKQADIEYLASLKELAGKLGLRARVLFPGWLEKEELWRVFHAADLFVMPSKSEGMPNVLLEALGCDLPCFGSNIPGIRDILHYDELMFDPKDEESLAGKIRDIFSDPLLFERVKYLCQERRKVFLFDWKEKLFQIVTRNIYDRAQSLA